jgi:hypothetical protein
MFPSSSCRRLQAGSDSCDGHGLGNNLSSWSDYVTDVTSWWVGGIIVNYILYDLCGTMKNIFLAGNLKSAKYIQVWGVLFFQACSYSTHYCSSGFPPNDEELWINFHKLSGLSASRNPEAHGCVIQRSPQNPVRTLWCQPSLPFLVIVHLPKNADTQGHGFLSK